MTTLPRHSLATVSGEAGVPCVLATIVPGA